MQVEPLISLLLWRESRSDTPRSRLGECAECAELSRGRSPLDLNGELYTEPSDFGDGTAFWFFCPGPTFSAAFCLRLASMRLSRFVTLEGLRSGLVQRSMT